MASAPHMLGVMVVNCGWWMLGLLGLVLLGLALRLAARPAPAGETKGGPTATP